MEISMNMNGIFQPCQMFMRAIMEVNGMEYTETEEIPPPSNKGGNSPAHRSNTQKKGKGKH